MSGRTRTMRRRGAAAAVGAAGLLVSLAACAGTEPVRPTETGGVPAPDHASVAAPTDDLAALRTEFGIAACPVTGDGTEVRLGLPSVATPCLDGSGDVDLSALRGTPMLVNMWATWCGPCRDEAPFLAEVAAELEGTVDTVGVDVADPDAAAALRFAGEQGWTYPHVADPDRRFSAALGVNGLPQTLLVDPDGRIVYRHAGPVTSSDQLRELVSEHLQVG